MRGRSTPPDQPRNLSLPSKQTPAYFPKLQPFSLSPSFVTPLFFLYLMGSSMLSTTSSPTRMYACMYVYTFFFKVSTHTHTDPHSTQVPPFLLGCFGEGIDFDKVAENNNGERRIVGRAV